MRRAAILVALLSAGCGSTASTHTSASATASAVRYASCMRSNGVASWPDPNGNGLFDKSKVAPQELHVGEAEVQSAQRTCQHLLPKGYGVPSSTRVASYRHEMLIYARCIRTHGVPKMPDPDARGHLDIGPGSAVDVNSPGFQAAYRACKSDLHP